MFSLIITVILVAVITLLALATMYYGGSAFRQKEVLLLPPPGDDKPYGRPEPSMKAKQLTIWHREFHKGTPTGAVCVLAWHWRWSITWRWMLRKAAHYPAPGKQGFSFMRLHGGEAFMLCFNSRATGHWCLQTQPNMRRS